MARISRPLSAARSSLAVVFIAVIALLGFVWLTQERLIFFPQPVQSTKHLPASAKPLEVVAADGARLRGWIVGAATARSRAPVVIYFGGNAEEVSWTLADRRWPADWTSRRPDQ